MPHVDASEAEFARYVGVCGAAALCGVFSLNGSGIITTSAGGALVGNDLDQLAKGRFWVTQAGDAAPHYEHTEIGYNYRMSNVCAAIGRGQIRVLDQHIQSRREVLCT